VFLLVILSEAKDLCNRQTASRTRRCRYRCEFRI